MAGARHLNDQLDRLGSAWPSFGQRKTKTLITDWHGGLKAVSDETLTKAVSAWLSEETMPPSLAAILKLCSARGLRTDQLPKGCRDCSGSGSRSVAVLRREPLGGYIEVQRLELREFAVACTCAAGLRLSAGAYHPVHIFLDGVQRHKDTVDVVLDPNHAAIVRLRKELGPVRLPGYMRERSGRETYEPDLTAQSPMQRRSFLRVVREAGNNDRRPEPFPEPPPAEPPPGLREQWEEERASRASMDEYADEIDRSDQDHQGPQSPQRLPYKDD